MCGISGWQIDQNLTDRFFPESKNFIGQLANRGPDATGEFHNVNQTVFLGHNRLSIIDLSSLGNQPMYNEAKDALVLNGEIYNYQSIKKDLVSKGYQFRSKSDSEVLLKSFQEWGIGCLERLKGMYAFAIWCEKDQKIGRASW